MGVNDRDTEARDNKRAKQKAGRSRRRSSSMAFDLRTAEHAVIVATYIVAAESGGAVRIGATRDGGALAIGCYAGDDYFTEYVKPSEDLETAFREIVEAWFPEGLETFDALLQIMRSGQPIPPVNRT